MKYIFFFLFTGFSALPLAAQQNSSIAIMLAPTQGNAVSSSTRERADRQILSALQAGGSLGGRYSVFIIQPAVDILEQGKIEGIKTQETVRINLQLKLMNTVSAEVLAVEDFKVSGAGNNTNEAINRAMQTIKRDHPALSKIIRSFQQKVTDYYLAQCSQVQNQAEALAGQKKYGEAFSMLHSVPQGIPCFEEVSTKKLEYFQQVQTAECQNQLQRAKTAAAINDYKTALFHLGRIDANAPCFEEAKSLTNSFATQLDQDLQTRYEWLLSFYEEGKAAETARWNAMTALGLQYVYGNRKVSLVE